MTARDAQQLADTIADKVSLGNGVFAKRLDTDVTDPKNTRNDFTPGVTTSFDGFVW